MLKLHLDMKSQNIDYFKNLDSAFSRVLCGKNLASAKHLLEKWSYPHSTLVEDTVRGIYLTGIAPDTNIFDYQVSLPTSTESSLRNKSSIHNAAIIERCRTAGSSDLDIDFWKQSIEERDKGWLTGPFHSIAEVKQSLGGQEPRTTRRFPLEQPTRAIDDYLESNINSLFGQHDKLTLQGPTLLTDRLV